MSTRRSGESAKISPLGSSRKAWPPAPGLHSLRLTSGQIKLAQNRVDEALALLEPLQELSPIVVSLQRAVECSVGIFKQMAAQVGLNQQSVNTIMRKHESAIRLAMAFG